MLSGVARGMLVSPWFAAGAGFVIATTAFIVAPHAQMRFPVQVTHCTKPACKSTVPQSGVPLPLTEPSDQVSISTAPAASAASGQTIRYRLLPRYGAFSMQITLTRTQAHGGWQLAFAIPGVAVTSVTGATDWQLGASGEVTVFGSGNWDSGGWDQGDSGRGDGDVGVTVFGNGTASGPSGCVLNGTPCHFSPSG